MNTKTCPRCKQTKPLTQFHRKKQTKDGLSCWCKVCCNIASHKSYHADPEKTNARNARANKCRREYREKNREKVRAEERARFEKRRKTNPEKVRAQRKRTDLKQRVTNLEKIRARGVVNNHVGLGKLPRAKTLKCFRCGRQANQYHHHKGYAKEHKLDVVPVCRNCHYIIDREIK